jgi:hypothetical protein
MGRFVAIAGYAPWVQGKNIPPFSSGTTIRLELHFDACARKTVVAPASDAESAGEPGQRRVVPNILEIVL